MIRAGNGAPGPERKRCWGTPSSLKSPGNTGMQYLARPGPNHAAAGQIEVPPRSYVVLILQCSVTGADVSSDWVWDQLLNTFHSWNWTRCQPLLARIHPKQLIPCSTKRQLFEGRFHHSELIFKAVLKVSPPFIFVCDAAMFVKEIFTISLLLWNLPTFKLSRLNKPETTTSMSNHKVDDV